MTSPITNLDAMPDEGGLAESAVVARGLIETALDRVTPLQREQFWNAIGLYYSTRRHPGAGEGASPVMDIAAA